MNMHNHTNPKLARRLSIIKGQIRGVEEMLARGEYCIDVITQISAAKEALSAMEDVLLEDHLDHCVVKQIQEGKEKSPTQEIMRVYKLAKRRK